jgi:hypothetical protein
MKTIIAGSREGFRYLHVANAMSILEDFPTEVVSGGAPGVDTFAIDWATNNGIDPQIGAATRKPLAIDVMHEWQSMQTNSLPFGMVNPLEHET